MLQSNFSLLLYFYINIIQSKVRRSKLSDEMSLVIDVGHGGVIRRSWLLGRDGRLQWHYIRVRTDWVWEIVHHAGNTVPSHPAGNHS